MIDVRLADGDWIPTGEDLVVVVEPCYAGVAVATALEAGWESVEIAPSDTAAGAAPIPLVSFEQPVPADQPAARRCRVRSDDLEATLDRVTAAEATPLLATPANARPAMASLARASAACARVTFVPALHVAAAASTEGIDEPDEPLDDPMTVDATWATGMLIRVLLEELDTGRPVRLADAAGVAVAVAQGAEDAAVQLTAGARWRDHLAAGGHADDLRLASAIDTLGVVPIVVEDDEGTYVARTWLAPSGD